MTPLTLDKPLQLLRICLHLLLAGLLLLAVARAFADGANGAPAILGAAVLMGLVYAAGTLLPAVRRSRTAAAYWLATLGAAWMLLLVLTPDGVWIAFPLFFLQLHLLPGKWSLAAVVATTVVAIVGFIWHLGSFALGGVIGPVIGAAVAVAVVLGYQALYRESEQRRRLIEQLRETRNDLAVAERDAGVLAERERLAARSTTPSRRACRASSCYCAPPSGRCLISPKLRPGTSCSPGRPLRTTSPKRDGWSERSRR